MFPNKQNCAELTAQMLSEMRSDKYSHRITDRCVNYIYRSLTRFCDGCYDGMYSAEAGQAFLVFNEARKLNGHYMNVYRNSIARLDHALSGDFHWKPSSREKQAYASSCFDSIVKDYEVFLYETGKTEADVRARVHVLSRFLSHAGSLGIVNLSGITAEVIYSGFEAEGSRNEFCKSVRSFFGYAYRRNLISTDLSGLVPGFPRHKPVPTVYSADEIETVLGSIDRTTDTGKRNYCIVLIAARLGLRSCDIAGLTFSSICHDDNSIRLVQKKTGEPIELPLLPEIDSALRDYITNARPASESQHIFLSVPHPGVSVLKPHTIYAVVSRIIDSAGIDTTNKRRGAHALRSSLASQLLDEGNSYPVIQKVLGHTSPEAAKAYVRIETEKLRQCALEVPTIQSGALAAFFRKGGDAG